MTIGSRPPRSGESGCWVSGEARAGSPPRQQRRPFAKRRGARLSVVLGSAALHTNASEEASGQPPVVLDVGGRRVDLDPGEAEQLRDEAAACAGRSSAARDLSLLLDRGLRRHRVLALRRAEAQTLAQLATRIGLVALAGEIATPAA